MSKAAVQKRIKAASAAIGEKIDLDRDTPEELERKADKRQHPEQKVVRLKRRKPAPRGVVEDPPPPAEPHAGVIGSKIEALWKTFDAIGGKDQLRFIHDACLRLGLDPLLMASPAAFGLADEEPKLDENAPAAVAPATDDAAVARAEPGTMVRISAPRTCRSPMTTVPRIPPTRFPRLLTRRILAPRIWRMPGTLCPKLPTRGRPARISMPSTYRMPVSTVPRLPKRSPAAR